MNMQIRHKALLTMLGVAVPSLVMFSVLILGGTGALLRDTATRQVRSLAGKSAMGLDDMVSESQAVLAAVREHPDVQRLLLTLERGDREEIAAAAAQLESTFLQMQKLDPTLQALRFIDAEGHVLVKVREGGIVPRAGSALSEAGLPSIHSIGDREFFRNTIGLAPGRIWVSNLERGRVEGEEKWCPAMVRFSTPLSFSDGRRGGVLLINVWGERAGTMINRLISPAEGTAFLVERNLINPERNGIYLFHQNSSCEFGNQTGSLITAFQEYPPEITDSWMSEPAGVAIHPQTGDILAHSFYSPYGSNDRGWVVVVNAKSSFFMGPLATIERRILWTAAAVVGLAGLAALFLSRSLTRPIQAVIDGTRQVGQDLSSRILIQSKDEVGFLAGEINRMAASLQESIAEKERVEQQICHTEKLASVGEMAAGLAHELNTPLGNIRALAALAARDVEEGDPAALRVDLLDIAEQTERCSRILTGVLGFARRQHPEMGLHDVNALIEKALELVRLRRESLGVQIDFLAETALSFVKVDAAQVEQVFVNLLLNAFDAMPKGGTVTIRGFAEEGRIAIRIADTGTGIAPEHLRKIFDPFFTTKEVGKGTGLGLSVSYGILRSQGGSIEVASTPGEGTAFTVKLPTGVG
jgi:two-component system NtrC family sensor kinase